MIQRLFRPRQTHASAFERLHVQLEDGARTTVHLATYPLGDYVPRVVVLERATPLAQWCSEQRVDDAIVGGFFVRPGYRPLGELQVAGEGRASVAFAAPWNAVRACVHIGPDGPRIARRDEIGERPQGDLLQAGPLLVADGNSVLADGADPEGFSAGSHQFDSDITDGRYPRAALAVGHGRMLAVACDGRTSTDAGMTLQELANVLIALGASEAINLDGGGSASLVHEGRLRNRPREEHGADLLGGRPVVTAIAFTPR